MLKFISIISTLLVLFAAFAFAENKVDLCALQSKVIDVVSKFTPSGQTAVKKIFLDIQHEFSNVLQKEYAKIKSENADTLSQLQAAEGNKLIAFLNAIGFNNASALSGSQVDWCQIQTDALSSYNQMSASSQASIISIAKKAMIDAKSDFQSMPAKISNKDQALIAQLMKTESMENLTALAKLFRNSMSSF